VEPPAGPLKAVGVIVVVVAGVLVVAFVAALALAVSFLRDRGRADRLMRQISDAPPPNIGAAVRPPLANQHYVEWGSFGSKTPRGGGLGLGPSPDYVGQVSAVDLSVDERGHHGDRERDNPVFWSVDKTFADQRGARWPQARWLSGQTRSNLAG
jgi:hypothetical protein